MPRLPEQTRHAVAPALVYAGEREWLAFERDELSRKLATLPPGSRLRPGIEHVLMRVTSRLLVIGAPSEPVPGLDRKDLQ